MSENKIVSVFADGGIIGSNPSALGGTFAWCHVDAAGVRVRANSGIVEVGFHGLADISNNTTELVAMIEGLETLPEGWAGTALTDSNVTLCRLRGNKPAWPSVPAPLYNRARAALKRLGHLQWVLLNGHPTAGEMTRGVGSRGLPVSEHNVFCDSACTAMAQDWRGK